MDRTCIAIVDATRARLFTFEHEALEERTDLVNPQRRKRPSELFSDSHATFEDHRYHHLDEIDAAFAREVTAEIDKLVREAPTRRLILCASPNMLGVMRTMDLRHLGIVIDELDRDLVKLTPPQLRDYLTSVSLLPEAPPRPGLRP
jgi:protein required for attachment to host cells